MMRLGFVSAIVPDLSLEDVVALAAEIGYECVEVCCWPRGKAERRYAGVTHIDLARFTRSDAARLNDLFASHGVSISGLGYYPNPLSPDRQEAKVATTHLRRVIRAAELLGVGVVNTFIGRDWMKTLEDNWPLFRRTWRPLVRFAEGHGVRIGIENCPMLFTNDEWPGGKNLAHCPAIWRRMFQEIPSESLGLNFDPSHLVWQGIDYVAAAAEFADRIYHVHAKDARLDPEGLYEHGVLALPPKYHTPKLPGLGDVEWGRLISVLTDAGYRGPVCVEVEDRAYEKSLATRKLALRQSAAYLRQFIPPTR